MRSANSATNFRNVNTNGNANNNNASNTNNFLKPIKGADSLIQNSNVNPFTH